MKMLQNNLVGILTRLVVILGALCLSVPEIRAADHGDSPAASNDEAADIGDVYFFLDPNDNTAVVMSMTVRGFIVPSEAVNQGAFDPNVRYQFQVESTGDAVPDSLINVTFSPRTGSATAQTATVKMTTGSNTVFNFTAPTTVPSLSATAPTQVVTTDSTSGVKFFAGEVDDPFFFDIPAFNRFVASVLAGSPSTAPFSRGRDSFAGYNILAISLRIPKALVPANNNVIGLSAATFRQSAAVANVAARGTVQSGNNVLIGGTIIAGLTPKRLIFRALGPSITGLSGTLADPNLNIVNSQGQVVASNDNWADSQAAEITASGFAPTNAKEAAIIATLNPGAYTAVVNGSGGSTGTALVEIYDLQNVPQIDRMGVPAVNTALVPFARKDEYNSATTADDAAGRFANDIVATLKALGTNDTYIGILAGVAVTKGDILRLDTSVANTGTGGGGKPSAAFPNGRRLGDDTIDTILSLVNNGSALGDNVNSNDVTLQDTFPFFAQSQQPRDSGTDDNTRN